MKDLTEEIGLLQEAIREIKNLRNQNGVMSTRLKMFDDVMSLLNAKHERTGYGEMGPDVVYRIEKFINMANETNKPEKSL